MSHTARLVAAAAACVLAGFAAGWLAAPSGDAPPADAGLAAELRRLTERVERLDAEVRSLGRRGAGIPGEPRAAERTDAPPRAAPPEPVADPYASWADDEVCLVALAKGDDLGLFKAALRRDLPAERRAKVLVALAAFRHRLEWHCAAERDALVEAAGLVPATTAVGAEAALALGYSYAARPEDRWRCDALFESVLRDAPSEEQRMKGAYGLAWRHDLGDEPPAAAAAAYREFLAKWGEKWPATPEVSWARERVAMHERGQ